MDAILAIETSCDETAAAVVSDAYRIRANIVASQLELHAPFGGVYPELASRAHAESISRVVAQALAAAGVAPAELDAVAVTQGPGLVGSLLVGINFAKGLALATGIDLLGINHLEGHIYSLWLGAEPPAEGFPLLCLIVSGGHTELVLMAGHGRYRRLGGTIDDAAGEAFDKVGRVLGLPFPGGPAIEKAAAGGDASAFAFPRAQTAGDYDFSFSGLKTAVLRATQPGARGKLRHHALPRDFPLADVAASFQAALIDALVAKTQRAAADFGARAVLLAGGVSANRPLRQKLRAALDRPVYAPPLRLCTDNAAMIGAAAAFRLAAGQRSGLDIEARASWRLGIEGVPA